MALEDTATAATPDQAETPQSAPATGDTAGAEQPSGDTEAQGQADEGAPDPESDEGKLLAELPPALRKRYNQVFTQKSQAIAEKGKRYQPYEQLIAGFEQDPRATIQWLAQQAGLIQAPQPGQQAADEVVTELAAIVGEDEAKRLTPAIEKLAARVAEKTLQPLKQHQEAVTIQMAQEQTAQVMASFEQKHPGWQKHEARMMDVAKHLQPNGMEEGAYLETLWKLATYDLKSAETTKEVAQRMANSAAASENVATGVNASRVTPGPRQYKDADEAFKEAAAAAKRGESWG